MGGHGQKLPEEHGERGRNRFRPVHLDEQYAGGEVPVLLESSPVKRMEIMESMVYEYLEMAKLTGEAESAQENENEKAYRKQAIQRQMEFLQRELDEMDPESVSDIRKFEKKIEEAGMNGGREGSEEGAEPTETGGSEQSGIRHAL